MPRRRLGPGDARARRVRPEPQRGREGRAPQPRPDQLPERRAVPGGRDGACPGRPGHHRWSRPWSPSSIAQQVASWIARYKIQIGYAYDPGGGHVSPGHNVTGTALDVVPGVGGSWDTLEAGLRAAVAAGKTVYYGTNGGGTPLENHGRGNHGHVEWGAHRRRRRPGRARCGARGEVSKSLKVEAGPDSLLKATVQGALERDAGKVAQRGDRQGQHAGRRRVGCGFVRGDLADFAGVGAPRQTDAQASDRRRRTAGQAQRTGTTLIAEESGGDPNAVEPVVGGVRLSASSSAPPRPRTRSMARRSTGPGEADLAMARYIRTGTATPSKALAFHLAQQLLREGRPGRVRRRQPRRRHRPAAEGHPRHRPCASNTQGRRGSPRGGAHPEGVQQGQPVGVRPRHQRSGCGITHGSLHAGEERRRQTAAPLPHPARRLGDRTRRTRHPRLQAAVPDRLRGQVQGRPRRRRPPRRLRLQGADAGRDDQAGHEGDHQAEQAGAAGEGQETQAPPRAAGPVARRRSTTPSRGCATPRPRRASSNARNHILDLIHGTGLPKGLVDKIDGLTEQSTILGDYADRAGQLTTEDAGGNVIPGVIGGRSEVDYLDRPAGRARPAAEPARRGAGETRQARRAQIKALLETAQKHFDYYQKAVVAWGARHPPCRRRSSTELKKHPKQNKKQIEASQDPARRDQAGAGEDGVHPRRAARTTSSRR